MPNSPRLATESHIFIPGAPPASKPSGSPSSPTNKTIFQPKTTPPSEPATPHGEAHVDSGKNSCFESIHESDESSQGEATCGLLPDETWIAIVCGVSKEQWNTGDEDWNDGLPDGFYVAPKDIYMPDLTAIADVLLGKLVGAVPFCHVILIQPNCPHSMQGYGTLSECVDSCTPFVYVSRPLFIEEHGLRLLLSHSGVGVELSRGAYEAGEWAGAVEDAWVKGRERKSARYRLGTADGERSQEAKAIAERVVDWVEEWRAASCRH